MSKLSWKCASFSELNLDEFHDILQLRINVFVVEQTCPYPELDDRDRACHHLFGSDVNGKIVAYTRLIPAGIAYTEVSLGRVLVEESARKQGIASEMLTESLNWIQQLWGSQSIRISAQQYLISYYEAFGFHIVGEGYLEDDIPHIQMLRPA